MTMSDSLLRVVAKEETRANFCELGKARLRCLLKRINNIASQRLTVDGLALALACIPFKASGLCSGGFPLL